MLLWQPTDQGRKSLLLQIHFSMYEDTHTHTKLITSSLHYFALLFSLYYESKGKGKKIPLRPGVAQRVGRGIALLFHDRGTRRG